MRHSGIVRRLATVVTACAVAVVAFAGPARASNIYNACATPWGGVQLCFNAVLFSPGTGTGQLNYGSYVTIGLNATQADDCTVTGWGKMVSATGGSWETPRYQRSCRYALDHRNSQYGTEWFYYGQTSAVGMYPGLCITLRWTTGDTRQQCYAGDYITR